MEEKLILAELLKHGNQHRAKLLELLQAFDLAELGRKVDDEREKDLHNKVLSEHEFFADKDCERGGVKKGDRITDETFTFLLSKEEWERYFQHCHKLNVENGLVNEEGFYITNWSKIVCEARNELYEFIVKRIVPSPMREIFWEHRWSVIAQEKLINITRKWAA